jgi:hypothetical protein
MFVTYTLSVCCVSASDDGETLIPYNALKELLSSNEFKETDITLSNTLLTVSLVRVCERRRVNSRISSHFMKAKTQESKSQNSVLAAHTELSESCHRRLY